MNGGPWCSPSSSPAAIRKFVRPGLIAGSRSMSHIEGTVTSCVRCAMPAQKPLDQRAFSAASGCSGAWVRRGVVADIGRSFRINVVTG